MARQVWAGNILLRATFSDYAIYKIRAFTTYIMFSCICVVGLVALYFVAFVLGANFAFFMLAYIYMFLFFGLSPDSWPSLALISVFPMFFGLLYPLTTVVPYSCLVVLDLPSKCQFFFRIWGICYRWVWSLVCERFFLLSFIISLFGIWGFESFLSLSSRVEITLFSI